MAGIDQNHLYRDNPLIQKKIIDQINNLNLGTIQL